MTDAPAPPAPPAHGHDPVLPAESLHYLDPQAGQTVVDCTLGRGGHSSLIAERLGAAGRLIGLDTDPRNLEYATRRLTGVAPRTDLVHANFADLPRVLDDLGIGQVDGVLADLGVSTNQLLDPVYGIGFGVDPTAPLDMRLDPDGRLTAAEIINRWPEKQLADVLYSLAQERYSRRIARKVVEARRAKPMETVGELADLVRRCLPRPRPKYGRDKGPSIDPATRTFMALRMAVNREVDVLQGLLDDVPARLKIGGRFVVISFHSGEDRLVKQSFRDAKSLGTFDVLTKKPVTPGDDELGINPRSRSAKLRAAAKL